MTALCAGRLLRAACFALLFTGAFIVALTIFADVMTHLHPPAVVAGTVPLKVFAAPLLADVAEQCVSNIENRHTSPTCPDPTPNQKVSDG